MIQGLFKPPLDDVENNTLETLLVAIAGSEMKWILLVVSLLHGSIRSLHGPIGNKTPFRDVRNFFCVYFEYRDLRFSGRSLASWGKEGKDNSPKPSLVHSLRRVRYECLLDMESKCRQHHRLRRFITRSSFL